MTLSPAATIVLTRAAQRPDHRLEFHRKLPTGGRHKMIDALLRGGMIAETRGDYRLGAGCTLIENAATGLMLTTLALTDAGMAAIGHAVPATATCADTAPQAASDAAAAQEAVAIPDAIDAATVARTAASPVRATLRQAAQALLTAWDDGANREIDMIAALEAPMAALRALLAGKAPRDTGTPCKPRAGTKQEAVIKMLQRKEGATVAQIAEVTGWASHTVRGLFVGLKKKGMQVEVRERVRPALVDGGSNAGGYTIYQLAK